MKTRFQLIDMLEEIDAKGDGLSQWEIKFIADMIDKPPTRFTDKQAGIIERIYEERIG